MQTDKMIQYKLCIFSQSQTDFPNDFFHLLKVVIVMSKIIYCIRKEKDSIFTFSLNIARNINTKMILTLITTNQMKSYYQ